jgi:hypothetical protein
LPCAVNINRTRCHFSHDFHQASLLSCPPTTRRSPRTFRDPAAGWVVCGVAAPFVRILEVRDATPAEAAAADAEEEDL